jgi:hypothetical protein
MDTPQIELLDKSKRQILFALWLTAASLLVVSVFRFVPWVNDALSGKPQSVRVLTETFARQFANQTQMQFPVIVEQDEHGTCQAVNAPSIPDQQIRIQNSSPSPASLLTLCRQILLDSQLCAPSRPRRERTMVQYFQVH